MLYDCVIFFNELELLELRMRELDSVVDRFVVVEAPVTFSGKPKALVFAENRELFSSWSSRIVHVVVKDMPRTGDAWAREHHQRDAIRRGLSGAAGDDVIMISDVDEIPSAAAIRRWRPEMGACRFEQLFCYYWINCVGGTWTGTRILPKSHVDRFGDIGKIRRLECAVLRGGGWHFSYLGGATAIRCKLAAFSHQDLNRPEFTGERHLARVTSLGLDLFGRAGMRFQFCELDERFPSAVLHDRQRYSRFICEAAYHEDWYPADQLLRIAALCADAMHSSGDVMEIGCWEGRSTVALANSCYPATLLAVDTWRGSEDENSNHSSVRAARQRDVYGQFMRNIGALTLGNVQPIQQDCHAFLETSHSPVRFAHIDASHDYVSVSRTIRALRPRIVKGGVLCGSDFLTASACRTDLHGGVERAVRELLPGFKTASNLWWWHA